VPLQGNWDFGLGDRDAVGTLLNVQPVMPFGISKSTNVILRVIMPLTSQPASSFNHIWSVSGANDRDDVNTTYLQPFANYNLGGGLSVGVSAEATGKRGGGPGVDRAAPLQRQ
jgi:hypothetical protein